MPKKVPKFKAHAYALAKPIQGQIWVIAVNGVDCLRIEIDTRLPSAVWMRYALANLPKTMRGFNKPYGVRVCYRKDFSVDYDLEGHVLEVNDFAVPPIGKATLTVDDNDDNEARIILAQLTGNYDPRPTVH